MTVSGTWQFDSGNSCLLYFFNLFLDIFETFVQAYCEPLIAVDGESNLFCEDLKSTTKCAHLKYA